MASSAAAAVLLSRSTLGCCCSSTTTTTTATTTKTKKTKKKTFLVLLLLVVIVGVSRRCEAESIMGEERTDDFDFDGLPGAQHEFTVNVAARSEDCFFQKVSQGATVFVSFEVLRGGDRIVNMNVKNAQGQVLHGHRWQSNGVTELTAPADDTLSVCVDNTFSMLVGKLVYLYIAAYVMDDWANYSQQLQNVFNFADNATRSLAEVEHSIQSVLRSQSHVRFQTVRDMYLVGDKHRYVQFWSLVHCLVIVAASVIQVVLVRRLFRTPQVTSSAKPRA